MLRACLQTFEWKNAAETSGEILNLEFGWYKEEDIFYPTPMTSEALPSSLLEIALCKCKGKCNTRRCSCKRLDPPQVCTELCRCSDECENVFFWIDNKVCRLPNVQFQFIFSEVLKHRIAFYDEEMTLSAQYSSIVSV